MSKNDEVKNLKENLLKSHWPKCNQIAQQLFEIGSEEAKQALIEGLQGKRHHIRTAAIKFLTKFKDISLVEHISPLLSDPSHETRVQAIDSIKELSGDETS